MNKYLVLLKKYFISKTNSLYSGVLYMIVYHTLTIKGCQLFKSSIVAYLKVCSKNESIGTTPKASWIWPQIALSK